MKKILMIVLLLAVAASAYGAKRISEGTPTVVQDSSEFAFDDGGSDLARKTTRAGIIAPFSNYTRALRQFINTKVAINGVGAFTNVSTIAPDGTRYMWPYNSIPYTGPVREGLLQSTPTGLQIYHNGAWLAVDPEVTVYSLPTAGSTTKGGVKVGSGLYMVNDTLNASAQAAILTEINVNTTLTDGLLYVWTGATGSLTLPPSGSNKRVEIFWNSTSVATIIPGEASTRIIGPDFTNYSTGRSVLSTQGSGFKATLISWTEGVWAFFYHAGSTIGDGTAAYPANTPPTATIEITEVTP